MNIVIISIIVAVLVLAAGIWFARPFMDRANRRLEKEWKEGYERDRSGENLKHGLSWIRIVQMHRLRHIAHTVFDTMSAVGIAWLVGIIFHLTLSKTILVEIAVTILVFHGILVPWLAYALAWRAEKDIGEKVVIRNSWKFAPVVLLFGSDPLKWYSHWLSNYRGHCLRYASYFHPLVLLFLAFKWRNSQKEEEGEEEEWGAGT